MIRLTVTLATTLALAACGSGSVDDEADPEVPEGRDGVLLEIREEGGFVPVEMSLTRIPRYVVFTDGTVVSHGLDSEQRQSVDGFPLFETRISDAELTDLVTYIDDLALAGIDRVDLNEAQNVADAPTTVLTYYDASGAHQLGVYALGFDDPGDPRAAILASMIDLLDQATTPPGDRYEPQRYEVLANAEAADPAQEATDDWPLDVGPADMADLGFAGWRCAVVPAHEVAPGLLTGQNGVPGSVWAHEGERYSLLVRPLFPHEEGC